MTVEILITAFGFVITVAGASAAMVRYVQRSIECMETKLMKKIEQVDRENDNIKSNYLKRFDDIRDRLNETEKRLLEVLYEIKSQLAR